MGPASGTGGGFVTVPGAYRRDMPRIAALIPILVQGAIPAGNYFFNTDADYYIRFTGD